MGQNAARKEETLEKEMKERKQKKKKLGIKEKRRNGESIGEVGL